jgi:hypothetical protein
MEILFLITFLVCVAVINADPICAAVPESIIDRTAAPELLILIVFLVCATIINFVGTWWREGGSHGGGMVEPEAVTWQTSLGLHHHHQHLDEAVLRVGMRIHTMLQHNSERDVSIVVERWNQRRRCSDRGGIRGGDAATEVDISIVVAIVCSNYSNSSDDKISL